VEIRQTAQSVPTRPIVLLMAILSVVALALTGWYVLTSGSPSHGRVPTVSTGLSPDAYDRNQQILHDRGVLQSQAETTHGH
jgi:heme A synthase